jgi:pimeloyl-ACP methyl ester carboxylesterase
MYVITAESEDLDAVAEAAIIQIGLDPAALSLLAEVPLSRWTGYLYALESDQGVTLAARRLDGAAVAVILRGELGVTTTPSAETLLSLGGFAPLPLADYLEFQPPPAPSTVEDIEDLNHVEFYSGRTKLAGKLILPDGAGPYPAVVCVHGSGMSTRTECDHAIPALRAAGLAILAYDKRGVGDSEGIYTGVTDLSEKDPSPSLWRMPQLADDALAAVIFLQNLREISPNQIGLIGSSHAGSIIPQVAANSNIPAFAVIVVGLTVPVGEAHYYQQFTDKQRRLSPTSESERDELSAQLATFNGDPGFDPRPSIEAMEIPTLWIWGDRDGWIPPRKSRLEMESIIAEHDKEFTILYDPDFGHEWPSSWTSRAVDWILAHLGQGVDPAALASTTPPTATTDETAGWATLVSEDFAISLGYPADWQHVANADNAQLKLPHVRGFSTPNETLVNQAGCAIHIGFGGGSGPTQTLTNDAVTINGRDFAKRTWYEDETPIFMSYLPTEIIPDFELLFAWISETNSAGCIQTIDAIIGSIEFTGTAGGG